jgi:hypothetical protein
MSERRHLPARRHAESFDFEVAGLRYTCTIGRSSNGRLLEVFLQNHKPGSQSDSNARDAAVVCSIALQYGVPLNIIRRALLRDSQGRASTPLGAALDAISMGELP